MRAVVDRFQEKVKVGSGCWTWQGVQVRGYGQFWLRGRMRYAHRVSFELHRGEIPPGLHVLHQCDNPGCVNPDHLFLGTHQDNMKDRDRKARRQAPEGSRHGCAKLTECEVRKIRESREAGRTYQSIAEEFGCSPGNVFRICKRWNWRHV